MGLFSKKKSITFENPRTGEIWICENPENKKIIDGVSFIEVHKPDSFRTVWINRSFLAKKT